MKQLKRGVGRPVVLVGMMGVGKSSVGRVLAQQLDCVFVDSDDAVEQRLGMSVADIFENNGEVFFRDNEKLVIRNLISEVKSSVVSTGGGALVDSDTLSFLKENSVMVWLDADVDVILHRLKGDKSRPLLRGDKPMKVLKDLITLRKPLYEQAHIRIDNSDNNPKKTVGKIVQAIDDFMV